MGSIGTTRNQNNYNTDGFLRKFTMVNVPIIECTKCPKNTKGLRNWARHRDAHVKYQLIYNWDSKLWRCLKCGKRKSSWSSAKRHWRGVHE